MGNGLNVLFISVDQWAARYLGVSGHPVVMTPTIDGLARDGIRFTNAYSECPICIPARRSIMTGTSPRGHNDRIYKERQEMPPVQTLAGAFSAAGYQTYSVGKLHVFPQRNRIGFDDALISEEARYEHGIVDDYEIWLGEQGYVGQEFLHGMGNNTYYTRPWHLPEKLHNTSWTTSQMIKAIKRRDPTRPAFYFTSYTFPHPPLVPVSTFLDMYQLEEIDEPVAGEWSTEKNWPLKALRHQAAVYSRKEIRLARRAYYAQCTHIDQQIRLLIGTLREENLLNDTVILFLSDHGDMLFDHGFVGKRVLWEGASAIPMILGGKPLERYRGSVDNRLVGLQDVMPTLLDIAGIPIPDTAEGISALGDERRDMLYCEVNEGSKANRMVHDGRYKLIYFPVGNYRQLFDLEADPFEMKNLAGSLDLRNIEHKLERRLVDSLYGEDLVWLTDGRLTGVPDREFEPPADYALYNQRGGHWPAPCAGYSATGANG